MCEKYDVYSLGCIFYYLATNQYLEGWLSPHSMAFHSLEKQYGKQLPDLICLLTHKDPQLRLSVHEALTHPAFRI